MCYTKTNMKGGAAPLGYTIVEVMVVLAVSSFMFLIAAQFVNGRQARASFTEGVNDFTNKLQTIADQVNDGQFTDIDLGTCNVSAGGLSFTGSGVKQGTNKSCAFLGKIVYLHNDSGGFPTSYETFNLAAAAKTPSNQLITTLDSTTAPFTAPIPDLTVDQSISQGLEVRQMRVWDAAGTVHDPNYTLGFIQGLGAATNSIDPNAAAYQTGSQTVSMIYGTNMTTSNISNANPNLPASANGTIKGKIAYASKAWICLSDGTRRGKIVVDIQSNGLNFNLENQGAGGSTCW